MMKKLFMIMLLLLIPIAFADEIGNYYYAGQDPTVGCGNGGTDYVCFEHKFYKAGTIVNVTLPVDVIADKYQFFVSTTKDSKNIYQDTLQNISGNWYSQSRQLENNFTVTANQELWFCMNYYSGAFEQYVCNLEVGDSQDYAYTYPNQQISVPEDEYGVWYGSSFPLKTRANVTGVPYLPQGSTYIYSDGTGNGWGASGIEVGIGSASRGQRFRFDDSDSQLINMSMLIESDCDSQTTGEFVLERWGNTTGLVNCSWNCSDIIGANPALVSCDVSAQNFTLTPDNYFLRLNCWEDENMSVKCLSTKMNVPTTQTVSGTISNTPFMEWQNYDSNESYFQPYAYRDSVFRIGYEPLTTFQCSDGSDNDLDGFTDYPDDPSCTSLTDSTESPFDYVACNNGLDDDGDGFIDLSDPSCTDLTDTDEYPMDGSIQEESECLADEFCLYKDQFPYDDDPLLHGWYGEDGLVVVSEIFGSNKMFLQDLGITDFNITKNISNANLYSDIVAEFEIALEKRVPLDGGNYTYFIVYEDSDNREIIRHKIELKHATADPYMLVNIYYWNSTGYELIVQYTPAEDQLSRFALEASIDQVLKTFTLRLDYYAGFIVDDTEYPWTDTLASKLHHVRIYRGTGDSSVYEMYLDNIQAFGELAGTTICDDYELPYYIVESFNGIPTNCEWSNTLSVFFDGTYSFTNSTPSYQQTKEFSDVFTDDDARYLTITFDASVDVVNIGGDTTIRLYDDEQFNFLTTYWLGDPIKWYYSDDGSARIAQNPIPTNQTFAYKIIIDSKEDNYDMFFNGTEVVSDATFTDEFYNLKSAQYFKIQTRLSTIELDNLEIYSSTDDGTPLVPDDELIPTIDTETLMCGHIYKEQPSCSEDSDCDSNKCLVNNKCARFDANYCTEKGHEYGNWCFASAVGGCALSTMGNVILDNFLLFIIFLILLMIIVYFFIMSRN